MIIDLLSPIGTDPMIYNHLYTGLAYLYPLKSQNEVKQLEQPVYLALRACIYIIL